MAAFGEMILEITITHNVNFEVKKNQNLDSTQWMNTSIWAVSQTKLGAVVGI